MVTDMRVGMVSENQSLRGLGWSLGELLEYHGGDLCIASQIQKWDSNRVAPWTLVSRLPSGGVHRRSRMQVALHLCFLNSHSY